MRNTISVCPECYRRVPAQISVRDGAVWMDKVCAAHGPTTAMVESDPQFYVQCRQNPGAGIYPGYFLDVTRRCNLRCRYCFYGVNNKAQDPTLEELLQEAQMYAHLGPVILTGGEPSLRSDLGALIHGIQQCVPAGVELLTNGTLVSDAVLDALVPLLKTKDNVLRINLSIHPEANGRDMHLIQRVAERGLKLESILWVIDDLAQIDGVVNFTTQHADTIEAVRIKAATRLWAEQKPERQIFTSEMLNYMQDRWDPWPIWWRGNKTSFFNLQMGSTYYMLVSWYSAANVDLLDIACPPYYRAVTGQVENIVTANIINEGVCRGWMDGHALKEFGPDG